MRRLKFSALLLMSSSLIIGCSGAKETTQYSSTSPTTPPTDPVTAPPKVVNSIGFYIKNDTDKYTHYMTKGSTFNSSCSIPTTETASQDVVCRMDALEGDLRFHGLNLNYNVPESMCAYLKVTPYYYYNWETGIGPSSVTLDVTITDGVSEVKGCSVATDNGTNTSCTNQPELTISTSSGDLTCVYDHSGAGGPNCCIGFYQLTKNLTTITTTSSGQTTINTVEYSSASWGGNYNDCIGGQGKVAWSKFAKNGLPASAIYNTKDLGANSSMTIEGPLSATRLENFQVSNYFTPAWHTHGAFKTGSTATSSYPYAIDPVDDRDGTAMSKTQDAYQIECLNEAHEVKHRIRLYVQKWNTLPEFLTLFSSSGTGGDPNKEGLEGVDCQYLSTVSGKCNDAADFDDLVGIGTTTPAYDQTNSSNRANWFPSEYY